MGYSIERITEAGLYREWVGQSQGLNWVWHLARRNGEGCVYVQPADNPFEGERIVHVVDCLPVFVGGVA